MLRPERWEEAPGWRRRLVSDSWKLLKAIDSVWITQLVGNENATMGKGPMYMSWHQRSRWPVLSPGVVRSEQAAGFWTRQ